MLVLATSAMWGQATTSVRGLVQDGAGASIPEASVALQDANTGFKRQALTDSTGSYQFLQVPPGTYMLVIDKPGFASVTQKDVALLVNTPATLNITMQIGTVAESVNVEAEVVQLNTVDAAIGNAFNQTQVRQLPLITRNVVELLSLQPGVTPTGEVLGARRDQNNVTLDGVDANDNQNAGLTNSKGDAGSPGFNNSQNDRASGFNGALPVPLDSVQEFRVTVGGQGANQGRSSGGQVTLVTKSGTNNFHGSAYEYNRNTATSANNWFSNRAGIAREQLVRNQFGASLGGKIKKDRAFFFFNYEQRIDRSAANQLRKVPSESLKQGIIKMLTTTGTTITLTPDQIRQIDPLHIGNSPFMLSQFSQMPVGNDPASGLDGGLNFSAFRFNAPMKLDYKAYVGKMDFHLDNAGKHNLSLRGTLADNINDEVLAQYPGQQAAAQLLNNSRGISALYTAVLTPSVVNVATFGLTRIGMQRTGASGTGLSFDNIDTLTNYTRGFTRIAPTYNLTDDLTWTKGTHTYTMGANLRFIRNGRTDFKNAFPSYGLSRGSLQGLGADIITAVEDFTGAKSGANAAVLSRAFQQTLGLIATGSMTYSYGHDGNPLSIGTAPFRNFASNEFELYIADSWRIKPSFTVNYGLRYSKYGVPFETNGLQVGPTFPLEAFYAERYAGMQLGIPSYQLPHAIRQFDFNGPANGTDSWWKPDNNNFAPRLGIAYAPAKGDAWYNKIFGNGGVFRAGGALVYDRFGSDLITQYDSTASFGLTDIKNLGSSFNFTTGSRYNGTLPSIPAAPVHAFPFAPSEVTSICCNYMGMSSDLKTPYSYVLNASIARPIPGGMTIEVGYAGRLSRKLLMQIDAGGWALLFKDPKSGQNWKEMAGQIRRLHDSGVDPKSSTLNSQVPLIPFIENMFPGLKDNYIPGSASANYYNLIWGQYSGSDADATHAVDRLRSAKFPNCITVTGCFTLYPVQSSGTSMWTNTGFASFHAATLSLRRGFSKGISYDFNYTLGHAIDNGGAPEAGGGSAGGIMLNPYNYAAFRGSSDFDIRHNINANVLYELPFGKGKTFLTNAHGALEHIVGGWQLSSIMRYRSGLPTAIAYTGLWPTNFSFNTVAYAAAPFQSSVQYNNLGNPSVFASTSASAANWKPMYPGEVGTRAAIRLDDLMNFDISASKRFKLPWEGHSMQFRGEAFNAFNQHSFGTPNLDANSPTNFGQFTTSSSPRVFQFALRYEF